MHEAFSFQPKFPVFGFPMKKVRRILVVDGSRVIRATLAKHLKGNFEVLEEANGESAWQTLMLDATIDLIISGIHTPKLEAYDLLARLKASSMRRLRELPFVLIVSDLNHPADLEFERSRGVTGFITKSMSKPEIVGCLNGWLEPAPPPVAEQDALRSAAAGAFPLSKLERLLSADRFCAEVAKLSPLEIKTESICVLVFGIDKRDALIGRFGEGVGEIIRERIAGLLSAKVEANDVIGCQGGERLAILSRGVDLKHGVRFAKRVCKSLAAGQITIHGQKVKLTASVGVASSSDDAVTSGEALLVLAGQRLDQALLCGGNTVSSDLRSACPVQCQGRRGLDLLEMLSDESGARLPSCLGSLGLQVLPLLRAMDAELGLALPLNDIEMKLRQRAKAEEQGGMVVMPEFAGETRH